MMNKRVLALSLVVVLIMLVIPLPRVNAQQIDNTSDIVNDTGYSAEMTREQEEELAIREHERPLGTDENHKPYPFMPNDLDPTLQLVSVPSSQITSDDYTSPKKNNNETMQIYMPAPTPEPIPLFNDDETFETIVYDDTVIIENEQIEEQSFPRLDGILETPITTDAITPSGGYLNITKIESTKVTVSYGIPSGASYGCIESYNATRGWVTHLSNLGGGRSGVAEISGLVVGETYMIRLGYYYGSGWQVADEYFTTTMPAEQYQEVVGLYTTLRLEPFDIAKFNSGKLTQWHSKLDGAYSTLMSFTGGYPADYGSNKMVIQSVRGPRSYWAIAGNPIQWNRDYIPAQIKDINERNDTSFGILHEISHNFDSYRWNFDAEFWANFKMAYVIDVTNYQVQWGGSMWNRSNLLSFYKTYSQKPYDLVMSTGVYSADALTYTMLKIVEQVTWTPVIEAIQEIGGVGYLDIPSTNIGKLNLVLSKIKDRSGVDVFAMLTARERQIYEQALGGTIRYMNYKHFTFAPLIDQSIIKVNKYASDYHTLLMNRAFMPFCETYDIIFHKSSQATVNCGLVNCPYHPSKCDPNDVRCGTDCSQHHSQAERMLAWVNSNVTTDFRVLVYAGETCHETHGAGVGGLASVGGSSAIVQVVPEKMSSDTGSLRRYQHEVSHLFGATHERPEIGIRCPSPCISSGGYDKDNGDPIDIWCSRCEADMRANLAKR